MIVYSFNFLNITVFKYIALSFFSKKHVSKYALHYTCTLNKLFLKKCHGVQVTQCALNAFNMFSQAIVLNMNLLLN